MNGLSLDGGVGFIVLRNVEMTRGVEFVKAQFRQRMRAVGDERGATMTRPARMWGGFVLFMAALG